MERGPGTRRESYEGERLTYSVLVLVADQTKKVFSKEGEQVETTIEGIEGGSGVWLGRGVVGFRVRANKRDQVRVRAKRLAVVVVSCCWTSSDLGSPQSSGVHVRARNSLGMESQTPRGREGGRR